ncbi:MAG: DUF1848 domain-containing protein [Thermodesulfobacteriota bacterium]
MIISASRRTDIPGFYARWFMNRVRAGSCLVGNPFNPAQVSRVSLRPEDVDCVVFWTRHGRPLLPHLAELEARGLRPVFLYSILGYPREIDPGCPPLPRSLDSFSRLADRLGPDRLTWRYDPIVLSGATGLDWHRRRFERIARALRGATRRVAASFVLPYRKTRSRLEALEKKGIRVRDWTREDAAALLPDLAAASADNGMELRACGHEEDFSGFGVGRARCIDPAWLGAALGLALPEGKDPCQRPACGCAPSRDIGAYDTCGFGCAYCYATSSPARARANRRAHDPAAPALLAGVSRDQAQEQGRLLRPTSACPDGDP